MLIKPKPQKPSTFFGQKPKQDVPDMLNVYNDINELGRRIRVIEERYGNLQNKAQITEENLVSKNRQLSNEIKTTNLDIHELKSEISQIKDQILMIIKELKSAAKKEELKVLERYLNMWEPMKFVTHDEFEEMVRNAIEKMRSEQRA